MRVVKWGLGAIGLAVTAGVIAFGVASFAGSAQAEEDPEKDGSRYQELLAQQLGISVEQLQTAQRAARDQLLDAAVAEGRLTAEQAEKLKSLPVGAGLRIRHRIGHAIRGAITAAAEFLGLTTDEVRQGLEDGKSLADLATEQGKDVEGLKNAIKTDIETDIDAAVQSGKITQERADRLKQNLEERLDNIVSHEGLPGRGHRFRFGPGPANTP